VSPREAPRHPGHRSVPARALRRQGRRGQRLAGAGAPSRGCPLL